MKARAASRTGLPGQSQRQRAVKALKARFGAKNIQKLLNDRTLVVVENFESLPIAKYHLRNMDGAEEGFYFDGTAYIVATNTPENRLAKVLIHELGEHFGLERMLGPRGLRLHGGKAGHVLEQRDARSRPARIQRQYP